MMLQWGALFLKKDQSEIFYGDKLNTNNNNKM